MSLCMEGLKMYFMQKIFLLIFIYTFISFPIYSQSSEIDQSIKIQTDTANIKKLKKAETYIKASVDESGQLCITTEDAKKIILQKDTNQVGFEKITISEGGHSVGWLADYPNASTSYPIPLVLKIYSNGILHKFKVRELPIWKWRFYADGKQVIFEQETVHFGFGIHYELRDIASERMIASYDPEYGPDNRVLEVQENTPKWVKELNRGYKK